jgi:transposase
MTSTGTGVGKRFTKPSREELIDKYFRFGSTLSSMAKIYDTTHVTIRHWLQSYGIPVKDHKQASTEASQRHLVENDPPSREELESLCKNNSIHALTKMFHVGQDTIYNWLDGYNITRNTLSESIKIAKVKAWQRMIPTKEEFITAYDEYKNLTQLGRHFDLSGTSIKRLVKEYDITTINPSRSVAEIALFNFCQSLSPELIWESSDRTVIPPYELDVVCHSRKLAIEYCGLYWHSEFTGERAKSYHKTKRDLCAAAGYDLITVFETDDLDLTKSLIRVKLGMCSRRVGARECAVLHLDSKIAAEFASKNHSHGHRPGSVHLGLERDGELLQTLTMGKSRFDKTIDWECIRMTTVANTQVAGGASRLFGWFIEEYEPTGIMTYADLRFGSGRVYERCGFSRVADTPPNYWYFDRRYPSGLSSRVRFQKHKLKAFPSYSEDLTEWQIMLDEGYDRIWDCGSAKYVYV